MSDSPPLFNSGLDLANLVVSSGLVEKSWESISQLYSELNPEEIRVKVYQKQNCTVLAFVISPATAKHYLEDELVSSSSVPEFQFLCTKSNPSFAIHKAALTLFGSLLDQLHNLTNKVSNSVPLIVTGHSVGGSIAVLSTLWLLERMNQTILCITFGTPLIGDKGFQEAISRNSKWNSRFLHVVANQDLVPRQFVSAYNPNGVVSRSVAYQPFGTYLLWSESGYTCVDDPAEVSELLVVTWPETATNQNPAQLQAYYYTEIVKRVESIVLSKGNSMLAEPVIDPFQAGILLQLEAVGVNRTQHTDFNALRTNTERREKLRAIAKMKAFDPDKKLNDIKVYMAYLEWYKKESTSENNSYYDNYKNKRFWMSIDVIKFKKKLNQYWEKVVAEAEKTPQRVNAPLKPRWLFGGTNYRRMVEPLDIADYYNKGLTDYKANGRSPHYTKLEKWLKAADTNPSGPTEKKKKDIANCLTEDSCFWAHVEEAIKLCKTLKISNEPLIRNKLIDFEQYVMQQIKNYAVSPDIFLKGSSFMQWWMEYKSVIESSYVSDLTGFMKNGNYNRYANGTY